MTKYFFPLILFFIIGIAGCGTLNAHDPEGTNVRIEQRHEGTAKKDGEAASAEKEKIEKKDQK